MKKFFMIIAMAVAALTVNAQSNSCQEVGTFGVKPFVGFSAANLLVNDESVDNRYGVTAGVEGQYMVNKWFAVSAGATYNQQGAEMKRDEYKYTMELDYVNIPVMANFYPCKGLALKVGLQPGFAVRQNAVFHDNTPSSTKDFGTNYKKFDLAMPVGISYEVKNIVIDTRLNIGLLNTTKCNKNGADITNGVLQLTVGYRL